MIDELSTKTNGYPPNLFDRTPVIIWGRERSGASLALRMQGDVQRREDLDQCSDGTIKLLIGMGRHQREANQRIPWSDSRSHHGVDEDTFLEEHRRHTEGLLVVTDEERDNRRRSITNLEAELTEAVEAIGQLRAA